MPLTAENGVPLLRHARAGCEFHIALQYSGHVRETCNGEKIVPLLRQMSFCTDAWGRGCCIMFLHTWNSSNHHVWHSSSAECVRSIARGADAIGVVVMATEIDEQRMDLLSSAERELISRHRWLSGLAWNMHGMRAAGRLRRSSNCSFAAAVRLRVDQYRVASPSLGVWRCLRELANTPPGTARLGSTLWPCTAAGEPIGRGNLTYFDLRHARLHQPERFTAYSLSTKTQVGLHAATDNCQASTASTMDAVQRGMLAYITRPGKLMAPRAREGTVPGRYNALPVSFLRGGMATAGRQRADSTLCRLCSKMCP